MGWVTVAAYFIAAVLCGCATARAGLTPDHLASPGFTERQFWLAMTVIFLCLGINKQLDLQSLLTEIGRAAARSEGWYKDRRAYQVAFIEGFVAVATICVAVLFWIFRRSRPAVKLALWGLVFTIAFVVLRAASFHHVDRFLKAGVLGWRWNWIIELSGITIVATAALTYCCRDESGDDGDRGASG
jgi:hypothetical protein